MVIVFLRMVAEANLRDAKIEMGTHSIVSQTGNANMEIRGSSDLAVMRISNTGQVSVGVNSSPIPNCSLNLDSEFGTRAFRLPVFTTVQRDALTPLSSYMIYNETDGHVQFYNGTNWLDLSDSIAHANSTIGHGSIGEIVGINNIQSMTNKGVY